MEDETLIDPFVREYKWIRYTYDFGDDWRHKIICEKQNPEYDQRTAQLLKWKGDHFCEDSGGVYGSEPRIPFLLADVEAGLENYVMPVNPDLEEPKIFREMMNQITEMFQKLFRIPTKASEMEEMAAEWNAFTNEVNGQNVKLEAGKKTNRECLEKLGSNNAMDYCKYLQLVIDQRATQKQRLDAIAQCFQEYPEYLLYVLNQEDYKKLQKLSKISVGTELQTEEYDTCISKAITLGLCEFYSVGSKKEIRLAADLGVIFQKLDRKKAKQTNKKEGSRMKNLKEAKIGETVRVVKIHGEGAIKRRIMDMGLTKGVEVYIRKVAPLGDPIEVTVRGYELSLRKADAGQIEVE